MRTLASLLLCLVACDVQCAPTLNANVDASSRDTPAKTEAPRVGTPVVAGSVCPGPTHDGVTSCFPSECSVGHWCDDAGPATCKPGCVSDTNCGPRDTCVREPNALVGRCESCVGKTPVEPKAGCVVPERSGTTKCFPECPAGQRCDDTDLPKCVPGCASDDNCGPSERCDREAGAVLGVCRSCYFE